MPRWRTMPKISLIVPVYNMDRAIEFLSRNLNSILIQTYKDYEIIISDDSDDDMLKIWLKKYPIKYFKNKGHKGMANNTNHALDNASGEYLKILYQDDYFYNRTSLEDLSKSLRSRPIWMVSACMHTMDGKNLFNPHTPFYSESENTIGSPSVLTIHKSVKVRFDPQFHWVLDLDLYKRLYRDYGKPKIMNKVNVIIGLGEHQTTHKLSDIRKALEFRLLKEKYDPSP